MTLTNKLLFAAFVASNIGVAVDTAYGYEKADALGGNFTDHTYAGKAIEATAQTLTAYAGAAGFFGTYTVATAAAAVNLPGLAIGVAIGDERHPSVPRAAPSNVPAIVLGTK